MLFPISGVQLKIIHNLAKVKELKFNDIKTFDVDPKNFVYHLKQLVKKQLLSYSEEDKKYKLTSKGKSYFDYYNRISKFEDIAIDTFIGLYIERDNRILAVKRKTVPYLGHVGIPTFYAKKDQFLHETAKKAFEELGLLGELVRPLIIETIYLEEQNEVITHSNMHIFYSRDPRGEVPLQNFEGEFVWLNKEEFLVQEKGYKDNETLINFFSSNNNLTDLLFISKTDTETEY